MGTQQCTTEEGQKHQHGHGDAGCSTDKGCG
jgi:hypothetical protein